MRLIDADTLQEHFEKVKKESKRLIDIAQIIGVQAVIDSQPTAYDLDKVVEQLEILLEKETALICRHVSDASYMVAVIGHTMLVDAVEIVKSGGVNTGNGKNGGMQSDRAGSGIDT